MEESHCCFTFILQCSEVFSFLRCLHFISLYPVSLLLVPTCLSLPFLLLYFALLSPSLDMVKIPFFFLNEELLSVLATPPNPVLPPHFGRFHLALLKLPMDSLTSIYSQGTRLCLVLMQLGQSLLYLLPSFGTLHLQQQFLIVPRP